MGSLPNLHELGRDVPHGHYRPGPALGHHCGNGQSVLSQEEKSKILHRHSGHGKITKARSNGHGSRIIYDDFMLEQMAAYSPVSSRSTRNLHYLRRRDSMNSSIGATSVRRLITVVRNTNSRSGPTYPRRVLIKNLIMLCASHLLVTSATLPFLALQGSVSGFSKSVNSGSLLLGLAYFLAAISVLFAGALIQKLGTNVIFLGSYFIFGIFYGIHVYPVMYLLVPAYVFFGLILGQVTLARISFLMTIAAKIGYIFTEDDEESKVLRRTCVVRRVARAFKASHDFGFILGSLITALIVTYTVNMNINVEFPGFVNKTQVKVVNLNQSYAEQFYTNCSVDCVDLVVRNSTRTIKKGGLPFYYEYQNFLDEIFEEDSSGERICGSQACPGIFYVPSMENGTMEARALPKATATILAGAYASLSVAALFVAVVGFDRIRILVHQDPLERSEGLAALRAVRDTFRDVRLRLAAPLALFIGLEQAFMYADFSKSYVVCTIGIHRLNFVFLCMGLLQSIAACTLSMLLRTIRRYYVIAVGFTFHACLLMVQMVWNPTEDDPALFYVISAAWGVCNAIWEIINFTLLTGLYVENWEAPFANTFFFRFLGTSLVFTFHGFVCNYVKLRFLACFMAFATVPLVYLEVKLENIRKGKSVSRL